MKNPFPLIQPPACSRLLPVALGIAFAAPLSAEIVLENNFEAETVGSVPTTGFTRVGSAPAGEIYLVRNESTSDGFGTPNKFLHVGGGSVRIATTIPGAGLVGVTRVTFDMVEPSGINGGSIIGFAANVTALDLNDANAFCALNVNNGALSVRSPATRESGTFPALTQDQAYRMVFTLNYSGAAASYPDPSNPGGPALSLDDSRVALWVQDLDTTTWSGPVILTTTGTGAPLEFMFRNFSSSANELYVDNFSVDLDASSGDRLWDGGAGDGLWSSAANWENDTVPSAGNALLFGPAANGSITNDLAADISFAGLSFLPTASSYNIGGAGIILAGPLVSDSSLTQTLTLPIGLATGSGLAVSDGVVNCNAGLSGNSGLKKTGAGTAVLAGTNTYTGTTTVSDGTLEISGTNAGTAYTIKRDNTGVEPVFKISSVNALPTDATVLGSDSVNQDGIVDLAVAGNYVMGAYQRGNIIFTNTSGSPATLTFTNASAISTGINSTRNLVNTSADLSIVFASTLDIGSSVAAHVNVDTTGTITVQGGITSTGDAARELRKSGTGMLTINGTSSYTGATVVNAGTLGLGASGTIDTSPAVSIAAGAVLDTTAKSSFTMAGSQPITFGVNPTDAGTSGTLAAQALDITNAVVALNLSDTLDDPVYVLATYSTLAGSAFATEPTVPSGYELQYDYEDNMIALVALPAVGFDSWASTNSATGQTLRDDHDNDGVANGIEYFIGGPGGNTTGFTPLPGVTHTAGTLSITWNKGSGYTGTYGTHFWVETSATLTGTWTPETIPGGNIADDPGFVEFTFPSPLGSKKFTRLVVTGP
jgi:autotransporter-associated beta strand protein